MNLVQEKPEVNIMALKGQILTNEKALPCVQRCFSHSSA